MFSDKLSLQRLTTVVLIYMVFAFGWWAFQLWQENDRSFDLAYENLELKQGGPKRGLNLTELYATKEYQDLVKRQDKRRRMVLAEGVFFTFCLAFGLYVINRSAKREVVLARQRRNFLLSITHELKSPIAALRLIMETLGKRQLQAEQIQKLCNNGLRDADRLQALVESLLLAARLEDNWRPAPEPINLGAIVAEARSSLQTRFPGTEIRVDISENFPLVQADKSGLTAVIQNLLENAVKYSSEGDPVDCSIFKNKGSVCLRIADQGVGIPNAEKTQVFEKFYRIGNEDTRQTTGTGLGLYIVKQVVEAHQGRITVTDNQPKGTVFFIEIPLKH